MDERNKWAFWAAATTALAIVCVPSGFFLEAFGRYRAFLAGVDSTTLRPTKVRFIPHRGGRRAGEPKTALDFVEFNLRKPQAARVELIGDFNGWKEKVLPLTRSVDGLWQLALPLAKGRHYYLFVVDGQPQLDPANPEIADAAGRKASVRHVR